ncbi:hypothetical protein Aglo03_15370 [Actinokineospora globicatena]|uniref:Uncharacterized protein n=1 Tax=Actinokineospora globicatena TaxID=103729 RepID=A0A9W6QGR7_9PSEU|nr:hypothetical protein Aglo03_15370 [Actinokineospora globicatena]
MRNLMVLTALVGATPLVPATVRPPQIRRALSTVEPAGIASVAVDEFEVDRSRSTSTKPMLNTLLLFDVPVAVPARAEVHPEDNVGQSMLLAPMSVMAPLSSVEYTASNGARTIACAGVGATTGSKVASKAAVKLSTPARVRRWTVGRDTAPMANPLASQRETEITLGGETELGRGHTQSGGDNPHQSHSAENGLACVALPRV